MPARGQTMDTMLLLVVTLIILATAPGTPAADPSFIVPGPVILADRIEETGNAGIICADVFARTSVRYVSDPTERCGREDVRTFAGWRIGACFSHAQCEAVGHAEWWPGTRIAEPMSTSLGRYIADFTKRCPAGGEKPLPPTTWRGILASAPCDTDADCLRSGYHINVPELGFDRDDPDGSGPLPPQAVTPELPCGLPYRMVLRTFEREWRGRVIFSTRLFKAVVFEQWASVYDAAALRRFPQFDAIPPIPRPEGLDFDTRVRGGGTLPGGDMGRVRLLLERGNYTIAGGLAGTGLLVVDGSLTVNGPFTFSGTMVVRGTLTLAPGQRPFPRPPER
ncbi:MAG TPA: hypothetical protein VFW08_07155 [bacterium]|nr:hypothetical protein [bacterium]